LLSLQPAATSISMITASIRDINLLFFIFQFPL
jgi:hypothetical protein